MRVGFFRPGLRQMSDRRAAQLAEYVEQRATYMETHPVCERCGDRASEEIHHKRGRNGKRLVDIRYWAALCFPCHYWIHRNPEKAKREGWLQRR